MFFPGPKRSVSLGTSESLFFISRAQMLLAPSMALRLLMQACFWALLRALTRLGIATAASRPMIATTIMISTSVKPLLRESFKCIHVLIAPRCVREFTAGILDRKAAGNNVEKTHHGPFSLKNQRAAEVSQKKRPGTNPGSD